MKVVYSVTRNFKREGHTQSTYQIMWQEGLANTVYSIGRKTFLSHVYSSDACVFNGLIYKLDVQVL